MASTQHPRRTEPFLLDPPRCWARASSGAPEYLPRSNFLVGYSSTNDCGLQHDATDMGCRNWRIALFANRPQNTYNTYFWDACWHGNFGTSCYLHWECILSYLAKPRTLPAGGFVSGNGLTKLQDPLSMLCFWWSSGTSGNTGTPSSFIVDLPRNCLASARTPSGKLMTGFKLGTARWQRSLLFGRSPFRLASLFFPVALSLTPVSVPPLCCVFLLAACQCCTYWLCNMLLHSS